MKTATIEELEAIAKHAEAIHIAIVEAWKIAMKTHRLDSPFYRTICNLGHQSNEACSAIANELEDKGVPIARLWELMPQWGYSCTFFD